MTTLTLNLDLADVSGIQRAITALQHLVGNVTPSPTGAGKAPAAAAPPPQDSTAAGEQGKDAKAAGPAAAATAASSSTPGASAAVTFDEVKKLFLGLSNSKGREACQAVLAQFSLAKLSDAKPEQYAALKAAIEQAAK